MVPDSLLESYINVVNENEKNMNKSHDFCHFFDTPVISLRILSKIKNIFKIVRYVMAIIFFFASWGPLQYSSDVK